MSIGEGSSLRVLTCYWRLYPGHAVHDPLRADRRFVHRSAEKTSAGMSSMLHNVINERAGEHAEGLKDCARTAIKPTRPLGAAEANGGPPVERWGSVLGDAMGPALTGSPPAFPAPASGRAPFASQGLITCGEGWQPGAVVLTERRPV